MRKFRVRISYCTYTEVEVSADSEEEAEQIAINYDDDELKRQILANLEEAETRVKTLHEARRN